MFDDFILISPETNESQIWKELDQHIPFKDPAAPVTRFLVVNHHFKKIGDGTCQMLTEGREYLVAAVKEYMKEIGVTSLKWVPSPSIEDKFEKKCQGREAGQHGTFSPDENSIYEQTMPRLRLDHYNLPR